MDRNFPISTTGLRAALDHLQSECARMGAGAITSGNLCVILDETIGNLMMHGTTPEDTTFNLSIRSTRLGVEITIRDPGLPFDPVVWPETKIDAPGGRGIALTKGLADRLSYRREQGANILTALVRFTP